MVTDRHFVGEERKKESLQSVLSDAEADLMLDVVGWE